MAAIMVLRTNYTYNPWEEEGGRLQAQQTYKPGTTPTVYRQNLAYSYDVLGNITQVVDQVGGETVNYQYDALNRLTNASASFAESYTYDEETGNLASKENLTYSYPATNQAHPHAVTSVNVPPSSQNTYSYDANGNMTTRSVGGSSYTLNYSAENRLMSVSGSATASYIYDGDGKRVKGTAGGVTTIYIGEYYEWTSAGNTRYYYGGGQRVGMRRESYTQNNGLYWLLSDHLGSTAISADSYGNNPAEVRYEPWGKDRYTSGTILTIFRFTGQRYEVQIVLYYYHARWYDQALGRFVQADTAVPGAGNPEAWDRFAYTANNPIRFIDPSGHEICTDDGYCGNKPVPIEIELRRYDVTLSGQTWDDKDKLAVLAAVGSVAGKMGGIMGLSAEAAFKSVYGYVNFSRGLEGGGVGCQIGSGMCTSNSHQINFITIAGWGRTGSDAFIRNMNNVVHELGHAFGGTSLGRQAYSEMDKAINSHSDLYERLPKVGESYGFASNYGDHKWQMSTTNVSSASEVFADQFVGWTSNTWYDGSGGIFDQNTSDRYVIQGQARSIWMYDNMSKWLTGG